MIDDWGGAYSIIDLIVTYSDGRDPKQINQVTVCNSSGLLSMKTTSRGRIKAGYNVIINGKECNRLGVDVEDAIVNQGPRECILHLGENPGGVTVSKFVPETKTEWVERISKNIEAEHGATVAGYWRRYKTSDRADEVEDQVARDCLREVGY